MEDFQNTGGSGLDRGSDAPPSNSGGGSDRQDRMDSAHAVETGNTRSLERSQDGGAQEAPSRIPTRDHLRAAFEAAKRTDDGSVSPDQAKQVLTEMYPQGGPQEPPARRGGPQRGPDGRWLSQQQEPAPAQAQAPAQTPVPPFSAPAPAQAPAGPQPPGGWSVEAKQRWNALDPVVREAIAKREVEVSNGFKQKSEETRITTQRVDGLNQVYKKHGPLMQVMAKEGITEPGLLDQMLGVLGGLKQTDKGRRMGVLATLAQYAGIAPHEMGNIRPPDPTQVRQTAFEQRLNQLEQQTQQAVAYAQERDNQIATSHFQQFAADKGHTLAREDVRWLMGQLLTAPGGEQEYRLTNGLPNLDKAYQRTCAALGIDSWTPAQHASAHRADHAANARLAGVSVGARAPTVVPPAQRRGPNGATPSVRDRLNEALEQHRA
jgi:hypothetical protein